MPWELSRGDRELQVRVDGQLVFNSTYQMLDAALEGFGLAYIPLDLAQPHVDSGKLTCVLQDWFPTYVGLYFIQAADRLRKRSL